MYFTDNRSISALETALGNTLTYHITTDSLWEGNSNLYFTDQRAIDAVGSFSSALAISAIEHATTLTLDSNNPYTISHTAGDSGKHFVIGEYGVAPLIIEQGGSGDILLRTTMANSDINITNNGTNSNINIMSGGTGNVNISSSGTGNINMNSNVVLNDNKYFYLNPASSITLNSWRISIGDTTGLFFERCTGIGPPLVWTISSTMYT